MCKNCTVVWISDADKIRGTQNSILITIYIFFLKFFFCFNKCYNIYIKYYSPYITCEKKNKSFVKVSWNSSSLTFNDSNISWAVSHTDLRIALFDSSSKNIFIQIPRHSKICRRVAPDELFLYSFVFRKSKLCLFVLCNILNEIVHLFGI